MLMRADVIWLFLMGMTAVSAWAQPHVPDEGMAIMGSRSAGNCVSCHDIPAWRDVTAPYTRLSLQGTFGPSLQGVGQRYSREQLRQWVVDARLIRPDTLMPPYGTTHRLSAPARQQPVLTESQIEAVVDTLSRFSSTAQHSVPDTATAPTPVTFSVVQLQTAQDMSPVALWLEQGRQAWGRACESCHALNDVVKAVPQYPRLDAQHNLVNLEDQINRCRLRADVKAGTALSVENSTTLSLSAWLHESARQHPIHISAPRDADAAARWRQHLEAGERLYNTRMGHMNLSCRQCHEDKVGAAMRAQRIPPALPVGFPVYRISWQGMGSMDRRIRACLSGVQAQIPAAQDERLRQLELFLKHKAQGRLLEGPSIKP